MFRIIFTRLADSDVTDIYRFLRSKNAAAAGAIVRGIHERVQILITHPESGSILVESAEPDVRKLTFRTWFIVYQIVRENREIHILRVWHSARGPVELEE